MRLSISLAAISLCAVATLTSCKSAENGAAPAAGSDSISASGAVKDDEVRRVGVGELRELLEKGDALLVDVRTEPQYREGHIRGALLMPEGQIQKRLNELPKDKLIVSYCACPAEHLSLDASLDMLRGGRQNVAVLVGGLRAWAKEGLPTESDTTR